MCSTGCASPYDPSFFCAVSKKLTGCLMSSYGTTLACLPCCPAATVWRSAINDSTFTTSAVILKERKINQQSKCKIWILNLTHWIWGKVYCLFIMCSIRSNNKYLPITIWSRAPSSISSIFPFFWYNVNITCQKKLLTLLKNKNVYSLIVTWRWGNGTVWP